MEKSRYSKSPSVLIKAPTLYVKLYEGSGGVGTGVDGGFKNSRKKKKWANGGVEGSRESGSSAEF